MSKIYILWNDSAIWGLLATHALRKLNINYKLILAKHIKEGILNTKAPAVLIVPGGNAKNKSHALGEKGRINIKQYVENGGHYLGFCGGTGLALSFDQGLSLCPWKRANYQERLQHFMSGHIKCNLGTLQGNKFNDIFYDKNFILNNYTNKNLKNSNHKPIDNLTTTNEISTGNKIEHENSISLPIWWPAHFLPDSNKDIKVLACYNTPDKDFWLADLPIASLPKDTFDVWKSTYGFSAYPDYLKNQPCVIAGSYGNGKYILSYAHLETPASLEANIWLEQILANLTNENIEKKEIPDWDIELEEALWDDAHLKYMKEQMAYITKIGLECGLLFPRTNWLLGWRTGIPGAAINNLRSLLYSCCYKKPNQKSKDFWNTHKDSAKKHMEKFTSSCVQYLLAERLALTMRNLPDFIPEKYLKEQRTAIFGPPMKAEGLYKALLTTLDELAYLQLEEPN